MESFPSNWEKKSKKSQGAEAQGQRLQPSGGGLPLADQKANAAEKQSPGADQRHQQGLAAPRAGERSRESEGILEKLAKAHAHFAPLQAMFDALPDVEDAPRFVVGETVLFPLGQSSREPAEWQVVRAEKMHYLLERGSEKDRFDHVFCSEEELLEFNKR
jgi:hypothetical protein